MAIAIKSPVYQSLDTDSAGSRIVDPENEVAAWSYWWSTSGRDLSNMLHEANYPENAQRQFLTYFKDTLCPLLGSRPDSNSTKSGVGWDGNPFEYSFEVKASTKTPTVRFVVDVSQLRPADKFNPLSITNAQNALDSLAARTSGFDDSWYRALSKYFVHSHLSTSEQQALIAGTGYQTPLILGFDIHSHPSTPDSVPVMAKVYFPPCFTAVAKAITRWQAVRTAIRELPDINSYPNILNALGMLEDYLSTKPSEFENGPRYLATDFVAPGKARLKIYMRLPGESLDEIWDYYSLGGRIKELEEDKEKFKDLLELTSGAAYDAKTGKQTSNDHRHYTSVRRKMTAIYFSLSPDSPFPAPKMCIYPANFARNDEIIAKGLDAWFRKYKWHAGDQTMEKRVKSVL